MTRWFPLLGVISLLLACQLSPQEDLPALGGAFVGYTYSETPVVQEEIDVGYGYTMKFRAYDLGEDARFVVYAEKQAGGYYNGIVRLGIQDPDGNAYTIYKNHDAEVVDRPILWKVRSAGKHNVTVTLKIYDEIEKQMAFEVPLVRQPVSLAVIGGVAAVLIIVVGIVGYSLKKRQSSA